MYNGERQHERETERAALLLKRRRSQVAARSLRQADASHPVCVHTRQRATKFTTVERAARVKYSRARARSIPERKRSRARASRARARSTTQTPHYKGLKPAALRVCTKRRVLRSRDLMDDCGKTPLPYCSRRRAPCGISKGQRRRPPPKRQVPTTPKRSKSNNRTDP